MPHFYIMDKSNHLAHYGHKGQKWGVRNYQNYDGTYTQAGLERYWPNSKHGTRGGGKERGMDPAAALTIAGLAATPAAVGYLGYQFHKAGLGKAMADDVRRVAHEITHPKKAPLHASKKVKSSISKTTPTHDGQTPAMEAIANGAEGYDSKIDQLRALTADCDSLTSHGIWDNPTPREREACNLGLDALNALGDLDWDESRDDRQGWDTSAINWFNFEDQTVGYSLAADLINQGYTAAQVKSLRDQVDSIRWTMRNDSDDYKALHDDDDLMNVVFELAMLDNDDYIDKCYELKNGSAKRGGKTRGGEIRTFETTKFGDVKQKSSYITGTDINNGIVKATRANNEDTATAQDNAIKALKSNKSIQDVAQLVGKAYHEYVVEQADYNHVSNQKTIPLLYPSKTKQSDMQASHEKLGKAQAAMSAEIRSMMRIALEKDYNKKTPYTNKGKPITYGELANKAVMQILKESNSKANRKDMLNVTLAARDYNRKQARRGSTVDEAKLERQRSEISKLRGKVYDEWGNIIDQKAYKQLQRAKANYKKTKQG